MRRWGLLAVVFLGGVLGLQRADATWSIIAVNTQTGGVAVGSATCLTSFDLRALTPVVVVGVGGAAVQSQGDFDGRRRPIIERQFRNGTPIDEILEIVSHVSRHQGRQYGIADVGGQAVTFSGSSNGRHASGVAGRVGDIVYAIQGNVLTGRPVVLMAEKAFVETKGDMAAKLMAAMEAARKMGGDGRCSCDPRNPTRCGSPPEEFEKSAHIAYMIVARLGDTDGDRCDRGGCARGDYFMNFNIPFQQRDSLDPVFQLQKLFDAWQAELVDQPDGVASKVTIEAVEGGFEMTIELVDREGTPLGRSAKSVEVEHAPGSAAATDIGDVIDHEDGTYTVALKPNGRMGIDEFWVSVDDGKRQVVLTPLPRIDGAACDVLIRRIKAKAHKNKLLIIVTLQDGDGNRLADHEVEVKVGSRLEPPFLRTLRLSNDKGRARKKFVVLGDLFQVRVHLITPPDPGGQCYDPSREGQRLASKWVEVP